MAFSEHVSRSLVKSITFRVIITCTDFLIAYAIVGKPKLAATVVIVLNLYSTVVYYVHERVWDKFHWGRRHKR